jgi:DNA topoisomerase-2
VRGRVQLLTIPFLFSQVRFVLSVIKGDVVVSNRKKKDLLHELQAKGFKAFHEDNSEEAVGDGAEDGDETKDAVALLDKGYDYLLSMKIWSLTMERVQQMTAQRDAKRADLDTLLAKTPEMLWAEDLEKLDEAFDQFEAVFDDEKRAELAARKKAQSNLAKCGKGKAGGKIKKKRAADSDDSGSEEEVDSDFEEKPRKAAPRPKPAAAKPAPAPVASVAAPAKVQTTITKFVSTVAPAPAKPAPVKKAAPVATVVAERREEEVRENMSLFERLQMNKASAVSKFSAPVSAPVPATKPKTAPAAAPAKKAVAPKKKRVSSSDEEDDADSEQEDDIFRSDAFAAAPTITASRAPRVAAKKPTTYVLDSDLSEEDGETEASDSASDSEAEFNSDASDDEAPRKKAAAPKKVPTKAPQAKAAASVKPAPVVVPRAYSANASSPPVKKSTGVKRATKTGAVDSLVAMAKEAFSPGVASPQPAKKARAVGATKPKAVVKAPAAKAVAAPKATGLKAAPAAKKPTKKAVDLSEDEEFDEEVVVRSARSPKPQRARKVLKYAESSEDEEEDSFIADSDEDASEDYSEDD